MFTTLIDYKIFLNCSKFTITEAVRNTFINSFNENYFMRTLTLKFQEK